MVDSSGKIPSSLLRGNINQLGDFDQCLGISTRVKVEEKIVKVQGKYCLATVDLHAAHSDMKLPVNLMQSRGFIRGTIRDVGIHSYTATASTWCFMFQIPLEFHVVLLIHVHFHELALLKFPDKNRISKLVCSNLHSIRCTIYS